MTTRSRLALACAVLCACGAERAPDDARDSAAAPVTFVATDEGCRQTAGVRPDTVNDLGDPEKGEAWRRALARGAEYECVIHPSLGRSRLVLVGDTATPKLDSILVFLDAERATPDQTIRLDAEMEMPPPWQPGLLGAVDIDANAHRDLMVGKFWGAKNHFYQIWRFDPAARRFVADSALASVPNPSPVPGRPCLGSWSSSSMLDRTISVDCLHDGAWRTDSTESDVWDRDANTVVRTISARRGDSMVVLKRETRPDSAE